ncbi:MAG: sensor histidine kinase [Armatimonadota bacterium]
MDDDARILQAEERLRAAADEGRTLRARLERAEQALEDAREREHLFRSLADGANAIIGIVQGERFVYVNHYFAEISGFSQDELLAIEISRIISPHDRAMVLERARQRQAGQAVATRYEFTIVTKDGREVWLDFAAALTEYDGRPAIIGIAYDITERRRAEEALQSRDALLRTFIEHAPAAVAMFDRDMRYMAVSRRWLSDYRLGERDIIGLSHYAVFPEIGEEWKAIHQRCLTGTCERRDEDPFPRADGTVDWVRWEIVPWYQPDGSVGGMLMFTEVITAQVQAREALERSNRALRMLSAVNEALIRITDEEALLQRVCDVAVEIGGSRMAWVGLAEDDAFHTVRPAAHAGHDDGYLDTNKFSWGENAYGSGPVGLAIRNRQIVCFTDLRTDPRISVWRRAALERGYESLIALPLNDSDKTFGVLVLYSGQRYAYTDEEVVLMSELANDLAFGMNTLRTRQARREAEAALARERAYLVTAIELLPFPLFFLAQDMSILRANRAGRELLRLLPEGEWQELVFFTPDMRSPVPTEERPFERAARGEVVTTVEGILVSPRGMQLPVLVSAAPIYLERRLAAVAITFQDITWLKEADHAKNQFLALLSHELKTPLTNIIGWGQMGQDAPEMAAEALDVIMRNAYAQRALLERLIILSRMLTGKLTLQLRPAELWPLLMPVMEELQIAAEEHQVAVRLEPPADALPVRADEKLLRQAVRELLNNAIQFTPAGGSVTVSGRRREGQAVLEIRDTGRGIPRDQLPRLLQPFEQIQRDEILGGLGIGLALVRGIVERHGGRVFIDSPGAGQGTTATVELPITAPD